MSDKILRTILLLCIILTVSIFFTYNADNWPFNIQATEAIGATVIILFVYLFYSYFYNKSLEKSALINASVKYGLLIGLLWTVEIIMNNILQPPLPQRDIYDNIFWGIITLLIFVFVMIVGQPRKSMRDSITAGALIGLGSGVIACFTALLFIIFGMQFIISDPLNIQEWKDIGLTDGVSNMTVYFVYQTLAGAVLHLILLGVIMGGLLGVIGGVAGSIISKNFNS